MSSTFAITAPETTVFLAANRLGEMPFTVTNMTDQPLRAKLSIVPIDSTPREWFSLAGNAEIDLRPRASATVLVRVEPPLGAPAMTHLFRLDASDGITPDVTSVGPSCSVVVPPSQLKVNRWTTPRGYLATLVGATIGGAIGELVILLVARAPSRDDDCTEAGCAFGELIAQFFFLVIAFLLGLILLWIGSVIGVWLSLRIRRYLGSKLTALFLAVLMIPWTIAMLALINAIDFDNLIVLLIVAPILLTSVPGVIARGAVLLIRTRHL